jgi:hypothetical protein
LFDPSLAESCCCRYLRNSVTPRQKPDHLEMPRGFAAALKKPLMFIAPNFSGQMKERVMSKYFRTGKAPKDI